MTLLIAIEGADGAGKNTAATMTANLLKENGYKAVVISFPRYQNTAGGFVLGEFLSGRMKAPVSPEAAAVLFALDRFESRDFIDESSRQNDIIIFDRYIASNVAYQAAKVDDHSSNNLMNWITFIEQDVFKMVKPDLSFYLDTPFEYAQRFMLLKDKRSYTERSHDRHEADINLQHKVRKNYESMIRENILAPWIKISPILNKSPRTPEDITIEIFSHVIDHLKETNAQPQKYA